MATSFSEADPAVALAALQKRADAILREATSLAPVTLVVVLRDALALAAQLVEEREVHVELLDTAEQACARLAALETDKQVLEAEKCNKQQCIENLRRQLAALEAERDDLRANLAEAQEMPGEAHRAALETLAAENARLQREKGRHKPKRKAQP